MQLSQSVDSERFCHMRFGQQYQDYCAEVPMLVPSIQSIRRWQEGTGPRVQPVRLQNNPWYLEDYVGVWLIRSDRNIFLVSILT